MNGCSFQTTIGGRVNRFRLRNLKNYKRGLFQISYRPRFKKDTVARYDWNCAERKHNELAISVIVPTFNRVETLVHCLSALECQQLPPNESFEVIVVDDSSTDGTATLVKQWNKNFSRVRLLRLSHNGGPGRARNAGVIASLGKLLVFVDSDVIVKPGFLYAHWKRHGESLGCVSVGPVYYIDHIAEHKRHRFRWWTDASRAFFCTSNAAVEKHLFIKSGRFDADFQKYGWEDLELGERLRYVFDDGTKESMTSKEKRKMNIPRYFVKQAIAYHYKPPWTIGDLEKSIEQERQRGEMGVLFYKKHPTFRVRLMIQLTWFHRCLWLILSLFGIINEYSVKPLVIWLMDKRQYGIAHGLWSIVRNRITCEVVFSGLKE
ncbi:glycosyl transferase family protein [Galdieria sulphuraria]|uniref:Glycosyl transferase family protein n=1 Tax=Galdieria sulphuraria TaxID=130081 RepID=M2XVA6_GALSU|nr:glycosyl transferase family protein [Galdieria sulphuraria]EME27593.1 glycosyl transferase family protein [Galdieria sulphuraria]|eukprot:XP_005704113.1 glycosyl transferase family protein [Galdieria sulphuraria]